MKIGIGNDHAAVEMKQEIAEYLKEKGYEVVNDGTAMRAATTRSTARKWDAPWLPGKWTWGS